MLWVVGFTPAGYYVFTLKGVLGAFSCDMYLKHARSIVGKSMIVVWLWDHICFIFHILLPLFGEMACVNAFAHSGARTSATESHRDLHGQRSFWAWEKPTSCPAYQECLGCLMLPNNAIPESKFERYDLAMIWDPIFKLRSAMTANLRLAPIIILINQDEPASSLVYKCAIQPSEWHCLSDFGAGHGWFFRHPIDNSHVVGVWNGVVVIDVRIMHFGSGSFYFSYACEQSMQNWLVS